MTTSHSSCSPSIACIPGRNGSKKSGLLPSPGNESCTNAAASRSSFAENRRNDIPPSTGTKSNGAPSRATGGATAVAASVAGAVSCSLRAPRDSNRVSMLFLLATLSQPDARYAERHSLYSARTGCYRDSSYDISDGCQPYLVTARGSGPQAWFGEGCLTQPSLIRGGEVVASNQRCARSPRRVVGRCRHAMAGRRPGRRWASLQETFPPGQLRRDSR